jgi:choline dehydrogenase
MTYHDAATRAWANLIIHGKAEVDSVMLDGNRAAGVRQTGGEEIGAPQVILSGVTYGSPAIVMRLEIGPADELRRLGIGEPTGPGK